MKLRSYLRLMRIPNVFTSFANVAAGAFIARAGHFESRDWAIVLASGCLYCGGMVWNDYFDREVDARERPERPIPSGEVPARAAAALGGVLCALGLGLCVSGGLLTLLVAALLCAAIVLYDAVLKDSWAGPVAMGACRTLNVVLGLSVVAPGPTWHTPLPLLLGLFTYLITRLSRFEVGGTDSARVRPTIGNFAALSMAAAIALLGTASLRDADPLSFVVAALFLSYVCWRYSRLLRPLWTAATGPSLGRAIGGGILLMPAIDASFVAASGAPLAAGAVFAFTAPAWWLKRWYYLS